MEITNHLSIVKGVICRVEKVLRVTLICIFKQSFV